MRLSTSALSLLLLLAAAPVSVAQESQKRGWLGIAVEGAEGAPPQVVEVVPDSPAQRSGLRIGDQILRLNDKPAGDIDAFIASMQKLEAGTRIELRVKRDERERTVRCQLAERPAATETSKDAPPAKVAPPAKREAAEAPKVVKPAPQTKRAQPAPAQGKGRLGVTLIEEDGLARINEVHDGQPAAAAGLRKGDLILRAGGERYKNLDDLVHRIQAAGAGNKLMLHIARGNDEKEVVVTLGSAEPLPGETAARAKDEGAAAKSEPRREKPQAAKAAQPKRTTPKTVPKAAGKARTEASPGRGIRWSNNLEQAQATARDRGAPVIVDFGAEWCVPCKKLDESFADKRVQALLRHAVPVKIDVDRQEKLADRFGVGPIPHLVVLGANGDKLGERTGYMAADTLAEWLGKWVSAGKTAAKPDRAAAAEKAAAEKAAAAKAAANKIAAEKKAAAQKAAVAARRAAREAAAKKRAESRAKRATSETDELRAALQDLIRAQAELNRKLEALMKRLEQAERRDR